MYSGLGFWRMQCLKHSKSARRQDNLINQQSGGDHEPNPKALHTHLRVFAFPDLWRLHPRRGHRRARSPLGCFRDQLLRHFYIPREAAALALQPAGEQTWHQSIAGAAAQSGGEHENNVDPDAPAFRPHLAGLSPIAESTANLHDLIAHLHQLIRTNVNRYRPILSVPVIGRFGVEVVGQFFWRDIGHKRLHKRCVDFSFVLLGKGPKVIR